MSCTLQGFFKLKSCQHHFLQPNVPYAYSLGKYVPVDTGPSVTVFSHASCQPASPALGDQLRTANGTTMNTFGSRHLAHQCGSPWFEWNFLLADVTMPILCADFLPEHHLLVDVAGTGHLDASSLEPISAIPSVPANTKSQLYTVLLSTNEEFRNLF